MPACVGTSVYVCAGVQQGRKIKRKTVGRLKEQNCKMFALDCEGFFKSSLPLPRACGCDSFLSESLVNVDSLNFNLRLWTNNQNTFFFFLKREVLLKALVKILDKY